MMTDTSQIGLREFIADDGTPTVQVVFPTQDGSGEGVVVTFAADQALDFAKHVALFAGAAMARLPAKAIN